MSHSAQLKILHNPTRFLFFTGKGGVGKTSISTAIAIHLADMGKSVLLVSTDSASNLDEMLGIELRNVPVSVPEVAGLSVLNIDPENASASYRHRVLSQMSKYASEQEVSKVKEELSGACTTEIAAFDEFAALLANKKENFDHIIFDTAPTGHTLRLLSLPKAWTGFLSGNDRGASCLGPHSGLSMQQTQFQAALDSLTNPQITTIILVTRPEQSAINEVARASKELKLLGLGNQQLIINGVYNSRISTDPIAKAIEKLGETAIANIPEILKSLPTGQVPLHSFDTIGPQALRLFLGKEKSIEDSLQKDDLDIEHPKENFLGIHKLVDDLNTAKHGLIMVMGKGGVGKTTIAAAIAVGLVKRGNKVHLSTTDPAAHVSNVVNGELPGLSVDRIDPKIETQKYIDKILLTKGAKLNDQEKELLKEDLNSPCTEEVAVFHAFSKIISEAQNSFVVLDTAPTGHSLLLMDATGAYHRQSLRDLSKIGLKSIKTPLMRLQDPQYTKIIIVTLPETTPISQAVELEEDLKRANIIPYAWAINKSIFQSGTTDPLLRRRIVLEKKQIDRVTKILKKKVFLLPWQSSPLVGVNELSKLVEG